MVYISFNLLLSFHFYSLEKIMSTTLRNAHSFMSDSLGKHRLSPCFNLIKIMIKGRPLNLRGRGRKLLIVKNNIVISPDIISTKLLPIDLFHN